MKECYYLETPHVHCEREPLISLKIDLIPNAVNLKNEIITITVQMCERHWLEFNKVKGKGFYFWQSPNNNNCTVKNYKVI